jgi:hypothetical protein
MGSWKIRGQPVFGNKGKPDPPINLPTLFWTPTGLHYGVDVERIKQFWLKRRNQKTYTFISKMDNCTGCVVEALRAGGLEDYFVGPKNKVVHDATSLFDWAKAAKKRIKLANRRQKCVDAFMEKLPMKHAVWMAEKHMTANPEIPSLEEWKKESDKNVRFSAVASRKDQIALLDMLI